MNQTEIRIGVIGNVDVGKSSLISVLTNNILDNGRGSARSQVMKHPHEKTTGEHLILYHYEFFKYYFIIKMKI